MRQLHGQQNIDRPKRGKSYKKALNFVRWNFVRLGLPGVEQGMCQLVGLACSQCSRQLRVWALTIALRQAGYFLQSRKTKWQVMNSPHHSGTVGLYFTHFFVSSIQDRPIHVAYSSHRWHRFKKELLFGLVNANNVTIS